MTESSRVPFSRLHTERLILEPSLAGDADRLDEILEDDRVAIPLLHFSPPGDTAEFYGRSWRQHPDPWEAHHTLRLAIKLQLNELPIGGVKFSAQRLSYFIDPDYWRHGYGFEAVHAACHYWPKQLGLARVDAEVFRENLASRRILESLGFEFLGLFTCGWGKHRGYAAALRYQRISFERDSGR